MTLASTSPLTLEQLNAASRAEFTALLDGIYEHSPWIAEAALGRAPVREPRRAEARARARDARGRPRRRSSALIRAHPELAGKAMVAQDAHRRDRTNEQGKAGLTACTPEEFARINELNAAYNAKFGFPFILAVRGPRGVGLTKQQIIATFERRAGQPSRLRVRRGAAQHPPHRRDPPGRQVRRRADARQPGVGLGRVARALTPIPTTPSAASSRSPTSPTRTARCAAQLARWMRTSAASTTWRSTRSATSSASTTAATRTRSALLTGSPLRHRAQRRQVRRPPRHPRADGLRARAAAARGQRLPFGIEVVGFAEEEGQRYKADLPRLGRAHRPLRRGAGSTRRDADGVTHARRDGRGRPASPRTSPR